MQPISPDLTSIDAYGIQASPTISPHCEQNLNEPRRAGPLIPAPPRLVYFSVSVSKPQIIRASFRVSGSFRAACGRENADVADLLIITGPPGSGKSSVSRLVAERFDPCVLVHGDSFFAFVVRGYVDPWLPESHDQNVVVTEAAATATGRYVNGGYMTIYDGMVGPWFLPTFLAYTGRESVHYAVLMPSQDVCVARVMGREEHGFRDEAATRHMYGEFVEADVEQRHVIAVVADDPFSIATEVARRFKEQALLYPSP